MRSWTSLLLILVASCSGSSPDATPHGQAPPAAELPVDTRSLVTLDLVAGADYVLPGGEVELGALFTIAPGWYIYWKNPGESGLETRARFHAPAGLSVGEVMYPAPMRFESPGNITSYGYRSNTVLFARARAAENLAPGTRLTVRVEATWLACRDVCIQGSGSRTLELLVAGAETGKPAHENEDVLGPQRARLPLPWAELSGASHEWTELDGQRALIVRIPGAGDAELFPAAEQPATIAATSTAIDGANLIITVRFRGTPRPGIPVSGVLRVSSGPSARYYELALPWS